MNGKQKTLQLKQFNTDYPVTLMYDKCKSGESQYGPWSLYGVEYEGEHQGVFADNNLHDKLKQYGKGTKLVIRKNQTEHGNLEWQVIPQNGKVNNSKSNNGSDNTDQFYLDNRTKDIHRQVALKIATISIGQSTRPWTEDDVTEIRLRMNKLLEILDGNSHDKGLY